MPIGQARRAANVHEHDFLDAYVADLGSVIDLDAIRSSGLHMGVDPLGGAGVHYWARIAERYSIDLTVVSEQVDPTFGFMTLDWDGRIRMDPSSPYAMRTADRIEGQVRHRLCLRHRPRPPRHRRPARRADAAQPLPGGCHRLSVSASPGWSAAAAVGKTVVSSAMIDRVAARLGRRLLRSPGRLQMVRRRAVRRLAGIRRRRKRRRLVSARDGTVWTTDKDGIAAALLSAEITARTGRDPGVYYGELARDLGRCAADRIDAPATVEQKRRLASLSPEAGCDQGAGGRSDRSTC